MGKEMGIDGNGMARNGFPMAGGGEAMDINGNENGCPWEAMGGKWEP